jgi:[NiFe] hydrogenase diaphorase moiety large subunit
VTPFTKPFVESVCRESRNNPTRLLNVARAVQGRFGCVSNESIDAIARCLSVPRVDVEGVVSFYAFLSGEQKGRVVIRLCDDVVDRMLGYEDVAKAFREALGIGMGETTEDGAFSLERTACIGMCDQAPAALVGDVVVTSLTPERAREIVGLLRDHGDPAKLVTRTGDGRNADPRIHAMVRNHIREPGDIIFSPIRRGEAIEKAVRISPMEVIRAVKAARLRGRGGAGFPTGMKWEFARAAPGERKYIVCNADEGEPGTFKDRVLLTERPERVFAGMTIAGYAVGADEGILYLRGEYAYLRSYLEHELEKRRQDGLLGLNIAGKRGVHFDIRIRMGAGAYVCGEETALLGSCEGRRGDPRVRPPFPAQSGYRGFPTVVNNVETLCCVAKILHEGPATFCTHGNKQSSGTKVLSISGDCDRPGIYEVSFGTPLSVILEMAGGGDAAAVQVGGPSGEMVGAGQFDRVICFDDLATGGALVVFGRKRDLLRVVLAYLEFFEDESCGTCTPCRVGTVQLRRALERIVAERGESEDRALFERLGRTMKSASRCGLGQTAANPVLSSLRNLPHLYEDVLAEGEDGLRPSFDLDRAAAVARALAGRATEGEER